MAVRIGVRTGAIAAVNQTIAELETWQSSGRAPEDWQIGPRLLVYRSLLEQLKRAPGQQAEDSQALHRPPL
jgi:hypothetical protein